MKKAASPKPPSGGGAFKKINDDDDEKLAAAAAGGAGGEFLKMFRSTLLLIYFESLRFHAKFQLILNKIFFFRPHLDGISGLYLLLHWSSCFWVQFLSGEKLD